jgi:hypothetical protein
MIRQSLHLLRAESPGVMSRSWCRDAPQALILFEIYIAGPLIIVLLMIGKLPLFDS